MSLCRPTRPTSEFRASAVNCIEVVPASVRISIGASKEFVLANWSVLTVVPIGV